MIQTQRTIASPVSMSGIGLHTGTECTMTFRPAAENTGIRFVRVDLGGNPEIPAVAEHVVDVSRGTTIGIGEAKVHTVEHVLAAIVGLQIDNIIIELDGIEPPVGDGSSLPYVEVLQKAGFVQQEAPKDYLVIDETVMYHNEEKQIDIVALPLDGYRITVMVDYQNPALGSQHTGLFDLEKEFVTEFAPARTFCFLSEVEALANQGLIKGGDLDNAVVIVDHNLSTSELKELGKKIGITENFVLGEQGILNNKQLRFKNEPVRHKLLDLMGDLALIGAPIKAQILAARPGHKANVEFAKQIRKLYQQKKLVKKFQFVKKEGVVFDTNAIQRILPHRYPFLLVDKIIHLDMDKKVIGVKSVTVNEPFFVGHFPGQPIMPGVLILEAMAQTGGILLLNSFPNPEEKLVYFMQINNAKFRKPVVPGDQLFMEVELTQKKSKVVMMAARSYVNDVLVAEAEFMAGIVDREQKSEE
ncbi:MULTISPECIES: bifunctional UDP-3-O-[3-hydroxymyristoyl] N-acetylglucosamine deacetylase/3-hydroxyacyl-ACP dehydratase [Ignavibacterium]|jgi:UDP-3-O-[3-hydroxymyristoyl] N-acetylglucosamine deacetylase/3-hydroxyacyl-[acyl-carrier-protein] dehydratase|uniref:bifunctional UDP-3-O-[3-hydroxymyristoyl] N-acetylglucosamine deacetylase/3-hydroxyacyl-ACP dehydratase n=1 Tax=Ignavibacterium TaxID=795750 RepID=UPI0025C3499F|nr:MULTISPECIES: bifunctional UDP-3-O-[3-hydroxymyristoyl] N-acetylglucosamine deacetylase/3-hydroxyacyl-ACP dehydratase [Ignavibacterium]MBI5662451.1 bifunctional UDP-3-O-[3-hydroxymyristoyl] N-acetylglucosamine deacetylase/3-hydroxyacyl-ACP dehydratase [Ignavibacterium album]